MSYRVVDLKEELEKRGLSKSGAKKDLVERLEGYILENEAEDKSDPPSPNEMEEDAAPSIQIDTNLEENDIVKEYMMMRQNQFKSALEESGKKAESPKIAGEANEDDEDAPLSRNKSPRKRGRGRNSSAASDSDESVKSPAKRMKSPLNEALSPPPPPLPFDETKSLSKRLKSPTSHVSDEPELPQQESPSKRSRRTSNKVQSYEEPPDDDEPLIMPEIRKKPEVVKKVEKVFSPPPQPKIKEPAATVVVAQPEEKSKVAAIDKKVSKQPEKEEVEPVTKVEEDKLPSPPPPATATTTQVLETKAEKEAETKVEEEKAKEVSRKVIEPEPTKEPEPEEAEEAVDEILVSETVTFDDTKEEDSIVNENLEAAPEEKKEQPVTAFRKLSRLGSNNESSTTRKKRTWGDSKKSAKPIEDIAVSSSELKDIIPDLKPVLEEIKHEEEKQQKTTTETEKNDNDDDVPKAESSDRTTTKDAELPKNPTVEDPAEKVSSSEKASDKSKNQRKVVEIRNLVRPFTSNQLVQLLKRTGKFDENRDFWIDKIKSHALVKYETADEAEETVMALDGVKWPSSNQKKLIVTFSSDDHFLRQSQSSVSLSKQPPRLSATAASASSSSDHPIETASIKRSASENYEEARERKRGRQDSEQQQSLQAKEQPKKEQKSLEVLFQKTKALPSIYWMPKS